MRVGFIGLGRMGNPMARHVAEAGHDVAAFDMRPEAVQALAAHKGVSAATSVAHAVREAEVVFTSLPGPPEVEQVVTGEGGLLEAMAPGAVYFDLSTNAPTLVRRLASDMAAKGITMLDSPVSGGVEGAEAGTLSVMVGGDEATFEKFKPVLAAIGPKLFYCGGIGAGSITKLCNNICSAANALILSEALSVGVKAGVDLKTLVDVISVSTGSSSRLTRKLPLYSLKRNFTPGFALDLSAKDTRLILELADEYDVPMAVGKLVQQEAQEGQRRGWGALDSDTVVRLQEERAGVVLELPQQ